MKQGTIFSIVGDIQGYDITLFNYFKEKEILLEPERKFIIGDVLSECNEIIHVTCNKINTPL